MVDKIKKLKVESMKKRSAEGNTEKDAYNSVLSALDLKKGQGVTLDEAEIIMTIRKEIKEYSELQSNDPEVIEAAKLKVLTLEALLPSQLTKEELEEKFNYFKYQVEVSEGGMKMNPKVFMDFLDQSGEMGRYDRKDASTLALKEMKKGNN